MCMIINIYALVHVSVFGRYLLAGQYINMETYSMVLGPQNQHLFANDKLVIYMAD